MNVSLPRLRLLLVPAIALTSLAACGTMKEKPEMGGFSSLIADPQHILKDEPPPVRPNSHMDPIPEKIGAFGLRWVEDLDKTATNNEPDPDKVGKRS
ncbi:MAG: hypothetical protein KDM63_09715 [Verrucomicrobiae bacterium]|nr:hypothetical protein [Verrucomicrobiae bacterium]MCB1087310.1 hypothetical protein [Verrucomicrobiae bacterium]MCB1090199.1 hypothetical protein [Verrucomicrobiae bacterium]